VVQPIYLKKLVKTFTDLETNRNDQAIYAGIVCGLSLVHSLLIHQNVNLVFRIGFSIRTAVSSLLYRKVGSINLSLLFAIFKTLQ
jgi:hypothetical protein